MEEKEYIKFNQLDNYILKPVFDNRENRWKILKGYARVEDSYRVKYTEISFVRCDEWTEFNDMLLSIN